MCSSSHEHLSQSESIGRRGTFLIVVKIDKNIAALLLTASDAFCPILKNLGPIMALVAAARSVPPYIDKIGRAFPRCRRVVMVRQAKRDVSVGKQSQDFRGVPTGMAKLKAVAPLF